MNTKHIFLINPTAGKINPLVHLSPMIKAAAKEKKVPFIIRQTESKGHAMQLAQEYCESGDNVRLYACGGDGTLNEVLTGALGFDNAQIACIPCGTGNDFIRNFATNKDFMNFENYIDGTPIDIDLLKVNEYISAAITSVGLDAEVAYGVKNYRRVPLVNGAMAYHFSILRQLCNELGRKLRIEIEDEVFEGEFLLVAICNGKTYGGGVKASPFSNVQDGIFEVNIVNKISRLKIATVISTYKKGEHLNSNGTVKDNLSQIITYKTAQNINIFPLDNKPLMLNIDGECVECEKINAKILKKAAKFILPNNMNYI